MALGLVGKVLTDLLTERHQLLIAYSYTGLFPTSTSLRHHLGLALQWKNGDASDGDRSVESTNGSQQQDVL